MLLFSDKTRYWAISLKAVSRRRVEKILAASNSRALKVTQGARALLDKKGLDLENVYLLSPLLGGFEPNS